jgi:hypothetical protein
MAVKDDLLDWVITNKNEIVEITEGGDTIYPTFRAGEAAGDLGTKLENVNNALGALKKEGLVTNPERGFWAWTGAVPVPAEKGEKAPRKRATTAPKDPLESARETLTRSLESITHQYNKSTDELVKAEKKVAELKMLQDRLASEEISIARALDSLTAEE